MHYEKQNDWEKMQAFVSFEPKETHDTFYFQAWYEPEFKLERACANYFRDRFHFTPWAILTPQVVMVWTGSELIYEEGHFRKDIAEWKARKLICKEYKSPTACPKISNLIDDLQTQLSQNFIESFSVA